MPGLPLSRFTSFKSVVAGLLFLWVCRSLAREYCLNFMPCTLIDLCSFVSGRIGGNEDHIELLLSSLSMLTRCLLFLRLHCMLTCTWYAQVSIKMKSFVGRFCARCDARALPSQPSMPHFALLVAATRSCSTRRVIPCTVIRAQSGSVTLSSLSLYYQFVAWSLRVGHDFAV